MSTGNLLKQPDMLLADKVPNCGSILHSLANHGCVCRFLDWAGAVSEVAPEETYSLVPLSNNLVNMSVPGNVL